MRKKIIKSGRHLKVLAQAKNIIEKCKDKPSINREEINAWFKKNHMPMPNQTQLVYLISKFCERPRNRGFKKTVAILDALISLWNAEKALSMKNVKPKISFNITTHKWYEAMRLFGRCLTEDAGIFLVGKEFVDELDKKDIRDLKEQKIIKAYRKS